MTRHHIHVAPGKTWQPCYHTEFSSQLCALYFIPISWLMKSSKIYIICLKPLCWLMPQLHFLRSSSQMESTRCSLHIIWWSHSGTGGGVEEQIMGRHRTKSLSSETRQQAISATESLSLTQTIRMSQLHYIMVQKVNYTRNPEFRMFCV